MVQTEKVKRVLPHCEGYEELTYEVIQEGIMSGMRKLISARRVSVDW